MADFAPLDTFKRMVNAPTGGAAPRTMGRFELKSVLGQGAQATVWLAFDPRMERQVAIKVLRVNARADNADLHHWLQEARSVARLTHPHIVPVFEADVQDQHPYLVFEYVAGQTLAQQLQTRGAMAPREAVELMLGVLGALQAAHAAGVVHLDLKPSNILIDSEGRARVTDFGIAARLIPTQASATLPGRGTPAYMAPEAAAGAAATAAMDVFSVGLVLAELLMGRPLVDDVDPMRCLYRIAHEDLVLPASSAPGAAPIDEALRHIVQQAICRRPAQRLSSAQALQQALQTWLKRGEASPANSPAPGGKGTLEFLLRRMRHKSDFPALSDSVARIQRLANSENESVGSLTNEILKDVALTNKLLRLVNTAHFTHAGGGSISTVSRAVALVGFNGIRNMAMSLVLLDHMQDKAHANLLKQEFLRCLMAGSVASELCGSARDSEDAFIGAMFQNLGRLLTDFYFPEEARQVRTLLAGGRDGAAEDRASMQVLGLSFEALGVGVAKAWGLPESLQRCMRRPEAAAGASAALSQDRVRWLALAGNEVADSLLHCEPQQAEQQINALAERYARVLGLKPKEILQATGTARQKLSQMAEAMQLYVTPDSPARRLLLDACAPEPAPESGQDLRATLLDPVSSEASPLAPELEQSSQRTEIMVAGIQDITNAMVENFKLNEILRMILETMLRALKCQHIVFCLRDAKSDTLTGRFGLGAGVESVTPIFRIPLKGQTDLFGLVCAKGSDTLITDASDPLIAARLPGWFRTHVQAQTFVLLPLQLKGTTFALIYADATAPGAIVLDEKQLSMLRTLRNQAVMAFRQAG